MIATRLQAFVSSRRCTLLGIGAVSKNCVDAAIELANEHEIPLILVASRRQIEAADKGGGYVNNWSTEDFARYVTTRDKKGRTILARDHGGPWQHPAEVDDCLSLRQAMSSAKESFRVDIESGFEIIHIDPSSDIYGSGSIDEILLRMFELYEFCCAVAAENRRQIAFEIGTDEQSVGSGSLEAIEYGLSETIKFCHRRKLPEPTFVVAQTGTKVMEMRNVGSFGSPFRVVGDLPSEILVPKMIELCNRHHIFLKQHNTDYLSDEILSWHPRMGIHSANVAPEFGVAETQAFVQLLQTYHLVQLLDQFLELAYRCGKWQKWMLPASMADEYAKAMIGGHYVFATPDCLEIKARARAELESRGIDVDLYLVSQIKPAITRYLRCFRLVR